MIDIVKEKGANCLINQDNKYYLISGDNLGIKQYEAPFIEPLSEIINTVSLSNDKKGLAQEDTDFSHMTLFVTQACNLACKYCYGASGTYGHKSMMKLDVAKKSINFLINHSGNNKKVGVSFFGGEPLLNIALIKKVIKYSNKKGYELDKEIEFGITTNGVLLSREIVDFFCQNKIIPVVSFDGSAKLHDMHRVFPNNTGSHGIILENITYLLNKIPTSVCRATVMSAAKQNEVEKYLKGIGFKYIQLTLASPSLFPEGFDGQRTISDIKSQIKIRSKKLIVAIKERNTTVLLDEKYSGIGWHLLRMIEQFLTKQKRFFACGAGRTGFAVSTIGDIFLCHRFVGQSNFKLGSVINKEIDRKKYLQSPTEINIDCKKCFAKYFCGGGCYHDNYGITGFVDKPAKDMCKYMKILTIYSAIISYQLTENDIVYLYESKVLEKILSPLDIF